jgi:hypothetical protein
MAEVSSGFEMKRGGAQPRANATEASLVVLEAALVLADRPVMHWVVMNLLHPWGRRSPG